MTGPFVIDSQRVSSELDELARHSDQEAPAVMRVLYTPTDLAGRAYVRRLAETAGLETRVDPIGNAFYRLRGRENGGVIGTGSHIDAIPNAGKYDGTVGVIGGIAALAAIRSAGIVPRRPIEVIAFTSEEPTRFGIGCVGSRMLSGALAPDHVRGLRDGEGRSFEEVRAEAGFVGELSDVRLPDDYFAKFVELHVEQGPILEAESTAIGVVTAIAAPSSYELTVRGEGGHAGAVLMSERRDALCAASELVLAIERAAHETGGADTVATVGKLDVHPGAVNSIPAQVRMTLDLRDIDMARRQLVFSTILERVRAVSSARRVEVGVRTINEDAPCVSDPAIVSAIEASCRSHNLSHRRLVSRAYHDALFISRIAPTAMIFVPSKAGVSHRPDEYTSPEEIACGVSVLASTLVALAEM
jgi:N-carbamoyl-L-amino-acid hydrolase